MAQGLQPYLFTFLLLPLVQGGDFPEFSLLADHVAQGSAPTIQIEFPDGAKDKLVLWDHFFNEEDRLAPKTGQYQKS